MAKKYGLNPADIEAAEVCLQLVKALKSENIQNVRKWIAHPKLRNKHVQKTAQAYLDEVSDMGSPTVQNASAQIESALSTPPPPPRQSLTEGIAFNEDAVLMLTGLGFSEEQVKYALIVAKQNAEAAADLLFSTDGNIPENQVLRARGQEAAASGAQMKTCPICGHRNPGDALQCELCTFSLQDVQPDQQSARRQSANTNTSGGVESNNTSGGRGRGGRQIRGPNNTSTPSTSPAPGGRGGVVNSQASMGRPISPPTKKNNGNPFPVGVAIVAREKMKWTKTGEQMDVRRTGSAFKVEPGVEGIVVGSDAFGNIKVQWSIINRVGSARPSQIQLKGYHPSAGSSGNNAASSSAGAPMSTSTAEKIKRFPFFQKK